MSSYVRDQWFYQINGRDIRVYIKQNIPIGTPDQLGRFSYGSSSLDYPDEDISSGLRVEYTARIEPFVAEAFEDISARASGTGIAFVDGVSSADTITDSNSGFGDFADGDRIRVIGSASNDGEYTLAGSASAGTLTVATGTFTAETKSESITIYQVPKEVTGTDITETSHVNLNRQLSLALVDYLRAKVAEAGAQVDLREYYMKQFYSKLGDRSNNLRKVSVQNVVSPYALK